MDLHSAQGLVQVIHTLLGVARMSKDKIRSAIPQWPQGGSGGLTWYRGLSHHYHIIKAIPLCFTREKIIIRDNGAKLKTNKKTQRVYLNRREFLSGRIHVVVCYLILIFISISLPERLGKL